MGFGLLLSMLLLGSLSACSDPAGDALNADTPWPQADGRGQASTGGGDEIKDKCRVMVADWNFNTSFAVLLPTTADYDFAIGVWGQTECDMSVVSGKDCKALKHYFLGFNPMADIPLSLADFSAIGAFDSNGGGISFTLDDQNQGIWVEESDAQINFKWSTTSPSAGILDADAFRTGGNCIIDIVTDPNGSGNSSGSTGGTNGGGSNG